MADYTPGPWSAEGDAGELWVTGPDCDAAVICEVVVREFGKPATEEDEANAQLIATAPELVEIAREVWRALDEVRCRDARWLGPKLRELHSRLGLIVAKAEGVER